jgi:two-component system sensor histidine kinase HydH
VIDHVVFLLSPEADRGRVTVVRDESERLPDVRMDPEQIQQVLFNVALNGVQASPEGGELHVRTRREEDGAVIDVRDHGPGIRPEHRERLFDPFFTTKTHGTGLGLAVSQRIMAAHGGRVDIGGSESGGTVVRLSLPMAPVEASASNEASYAR